MRISDESTWPGDVLTYLDQFGWVFRVWERRDIDALRQLPGIKRYAPDAEPSLAYFRPFKSPAQKKGERFYFLHYLGFLSHPDNHAWYCKADRDRYANSSGKTTPSAAT